MLVIKIGSTIKYRDNFGCGAQRTTIVRGIQHCAMQGAKDGEAVQSIAWYAKNYGCFDLANGHWCYGKQIDVMEV